jgi:uncharacterized damage-inducible protein DinB
MDSKMQSIFSMFAHYNEWANRRLYAAVAKLSDEDYRADGGAFFGSVHRTLNHLLVGDRVWMRRFTGEGPIHTALDLVPCDDLASLTTERQAEDRRIIHYVESLDGERLALTFSYRTITSPADVTQPLAPALSHFFNHQTHHRGQAHALITGLGGRDAAPPLDLILFQRESGMGLT